jgi:hypothetical protein
MQKAASSVPLKIFLQTNASDLFPLNTYHKPLSEVPPSMSATWAEAESQISEMAALIHERCHDKTYFRVKWADGERYEVRLDIVRVVVEVPLPLAGHVRRALKFTAGRWRPANTTEEQQGEFLAENERLRPGGAAWAARILDGYELGGAR